MAATAVTQPTRTDSATLEHVDQRMILHDISWETYESLLADFVDTPTPRITYDRGTMELLVALSTKHEDAKHALTSIVEAVTVERDIDIRIVGSMTYKRPDISGGFEPDVSFYIQHERAVRGIDQIDASVHPPPDLVIEIDISQRSLDRLPLYAAFGIPEVWRVEGGAVALYSLRADGAGYDTGGTSRVLPPLDGATLTRFLAQRADTGRAAWVRAVRAWAAEAAS